MSKERFLSKEDYKTIFTSLDLPWQDYKPGPDGWINMKGIEHLNYPLSVNIENGNYSYFESEDKGGNIVDLVKLVIDSSAEGAIREINLILDRKSKIEQPKLSPGYEFAGDFLPVKGEDNGNYYFRGPLTILHADIQESSKTVWFEIFRRCGNGKDYSFADQENIADSLNISTSTVKRALKELKELGAIKETKRKGRGRNRFPICSKEFAQSSI